jgi:lipopolysaccharide transport system permease protein
MTLRALCIKTQLPFTTELKIGDITLNLSLIFELAKRDITEKYSGSTLGVLWNFIYPLVDIFIFTVIFSNLMGSRLPGSSSAYSYGFYLTSGVIPWNAFSNTVSRTATAFLDKKHIISKVKVDLSSFSLYIAISESITFVVTMGIFLFLLLISGYGMKPLILFVPLIYLVQQIFAYSLGFFIGIFVVFIRDLKEIIRIILQFWFWFTPIVYVYDILPEFVKKLMIYNPAFSFIQAYHSVFIYKENPNFESILYLFLLSLVILMCAGIIFKKLEKDIRDFI